MIRIKSMGLFILILSLNAFASPLYENMGEFIDKIKSEKSRRKQDVMLEEIFNERNKLAFTIKSLLKKENDIESKGWLIYISGKLRLKSLSGVLVVNYLDFIDLGRNTKAISFPRWSKFPARDALAQIGMKPIEYLLFEIENKHSKYSCILVLTTIRYIIISNLRYVDSIQFTKLILEAAYKKQKDPDKQKNLKKAIELISRKDYLKLEREYRRTAILKARELQK